MTETLGFPPPSVGHDEPTPLAPPAAPSGFAPPPSGTAPDPASALVAPLEAAPVTPLSTPLTAPAAASLPTLTAAAPRPAAASKPATPGAIPAMPALPPLPSFVIHDAPAAPPPTPAEAAEPAGPVVITADMLGSLDLDAAPMASPIVTTMPSSPPLTELTTPTQIATFDPGPAADATPAAPVLPARPSRGRPTARRDRSTGSLVLKVVLAALVLTIGWFVWSKVSGDDESSAEIGAAPDTVVTPATDANGQAQIMPPQQVGMPPIQVLPNPAGTFLVSVGPVQFVMPSLPTQTGASDPSQPAVAAVKFTASGPAGVMTAVVSLDTRPVTAESRTAFCDVALAGVLAGEGATATADTVVSPDEPLVRTATFAGPTGVGDFHCHYDQDYAVVLTGIGATAPMGQPFTEAVTSLTFHGKS